MKDFLLALFMGVVGLVLSVFYTVVVILTYVFVNYAWMIIPLVAYWIFKTYL